MKRKARYDMPSLATSGAPLVCAEGCKCGRPFGAGGVKHLINHHILHNGGDKYERFSEMKDVINICRVVVEGEHIEISKKDWKIELELADAYGYKGCLVCFKELVRANTRTAVQLIGWKSTFWRDCKACELVMDDVVLTNACKEIGDESTYDEGKLQSLLSGSIESSEQVYPKLPTTQQEWATLTTNPHEFAWAVVEADKTIDLAVDRLLHVRPLVFHSALGENSHKRAHREQKSPYTLEKVGKVVEQVNTWLKSADYDGEIPMEGLKSQPDEKLWQVCIDDYGEVVQKRGRVQASMLYSYIHTLQHSGRAKSKALNVPKEAFSEVPAQETRQEYLTTLDAAVQAPANTNPEAHKNPAKRRNDNPDQSSPQRKRADLITPTAGGNPGCTLLPSAGAVPAAPLPRAAATPAAAPATHTSPPEGAAPGVAASEKQQQQQHTDAQPEDASAGHIQKCLETLKKEKATIEGKIDRLNDQREALTAECGKISEAIAALERDG